MADCNQHHEWVTWRRVGDVDVTTIPLLYWSDPPNQPTAKTEAEIIRLITESIDADLQEMSDPEPTCGSDCREEVIPPVVTTFDGSQEDRPRGYAIWREDVQGRRVWFAASAAFTLERTDRAKRCAPKQVGKTAFHVPDQGGAGTGQRRISS